MDDEWLQAGLSLPSRAAEAASAALFECGASSVWEDLPDRPGRAVLRSAFGTGDAMRLMTELPLAAERIAEAFGFGEGEVSVELEVKLLEDWDAAWRADQSPVRVSGRLTVAHSFWVGAVTCPGGGTGEDGGGSPPHHVLRMDPGAAFGSGRHPTTFLCLKLLSAAADEAEGLAADPSVGPPAAGAAGAAPSGNAPARVLDLGAGSGILAIAAARLFPGADVLGLDRDEDTVPVARRNAEANGASGSATFLAGTLDGPRGGFDLLLANLTLNPLLELARDLTLAASPGARLVLSGLLADQAEECARAYQRLGWHWLRHLGQAEWSALELAFPGWPGGTADGAEGGPDPARLLIPEPSLETPAPPDAPVL
ncbi:MAG: 50S ribosomal protein L11 methyltransferase [Deltaproteobacteria bacterium]|jgi:ribosomal protein L11 methyltransferase|nr:50S ribosomal protein L11 methyltransferase [Deltaproteobacteria bacterium]